MKDNDVDTYITMFAKLACKALYHEDDPAVLEKFKAGLPLDLLEPCMQHDDPRNWDAWTQSARKRQAILTSIKTHRPIEPPRTPSPMERYSSSPPIPDLAVPMELDNVTIPRVTIPRVDCSYVFFFFFMLTNPSPCRLPSPCMTPVDDM